MTAFDFTSVTRIVFGRGRFERIGAIASEFGRRALVVTNSDRAGKLGLLERLARLLDASGVQHALFRVESEPDTQTVDRGIQAAQAAGSELVIGLGGGSAIDAAKAIAGLLVSGGTALDYMEVVGRGRKLERPGAPFIAVPTTAGTGAEVTRNAVIGCAEKQFKASIRSEHLLARVALVDAELALHVRPEITARTGMDALTQLIESYTSKNAQPMTDALALLGIRHTARSLRRAYANGGDLDAREDMALAALLSGIALGNAGLGAVHGFAAPLGARYPVPHGTVCAALLPHVIAANIAASRESEGEAGQAVLQRYSQIGRCAAAAEAEDSPKAQGLAGNEDGRGRPSCRDALSDDEALAFLREMCSKLVQDLGIPGLGSYGLAEIDFPEVIALAKKSSSMRYNPMALSDDALAAILLRAL